MSLPPSSLNQAYCHVSVLQAGIVTVPLAWILDGAGQDDFAEAPALSFLIRHTTNNDTLLFDLGVRQDWETGLLPHVVEHALKRLRFQIRVPQDVVEALAKGGTQPSDIKHVLISHLHFDHIGDPALFPDATFLVGEGVRPLIADGYPKNPHSTIPTDLLPDGRAEFLDPAGWPRLGPFDHALDFYGDGSVYVVDAGHGHMPGHLNLLVRTSADGGWLFLAGDSVHNWAILKGVDKIGHHPIYGCAHVDVDAAERHIERIRTLMRENSRVRVLLAHDEPWYTEHKDGAAFWPGTVESL